MGSLYLNSNLANIFKASSKLTLSENGITYSLIRVGCFGIITATIGSGSLNKDIIKGATIATLPEDWYPETEYVEFLDTGSKLRLSIQGNKITTFDDNGIQSGTALRFSLIYLLKIT